MSLRRKKAEWRLMMRGAGSGEPGPGLLSLGGGCAVEFWAFLCHSLVNDLASRPVLLTLSS